MLLFCVCLVLFSIMPLRFANLFHVSIINIFFLLTGHITLNGCILYSLYLFFIADGYLCFFPNLGLFYVQLLMNIYVKFYVDMFSIILSIVQF